LISASQEFQA